MSAMVQPMSSMCLHGTSMSNLTSYSRKSIAMITCNVVLSPKKPYFRFDGSIFSSKAVGFFVNGLVRGLFRFFNSISNLI